MSFLKQLRSWQLSEISRGLFLPFPCSAPFTLSSEKNVILSLDLDAVFLETETCRSSALAAEIMYISCLFSEVNPNFINEFHLVFVEHSFISICRAHLSRAYNSRNGSLWAPAAIVRSSAFGRFHEFLEMWSPDEVYMPRIRRRGKKNQSVNVITCGLGHCGDILHRIYLNWWHSPKEAGPMLRTNQLPRKRITARSVRDTF